MRLMFAHTLSFSRLLVVACCCRRTCEPRGTAQQRATDGGNKGEPARYRKLVCQCGVRTAKLDSAPRLTPCGRPAGRRAVVWRRTVLSTLSSACKKVGARVEKLALCSMHASFLFEVGVGSQINSPHAATLIQAYAERIPTFVILSLRRLTVVSKPGGCLHTTPPFFESLFMQTPFSTF